MSWAPRFPIYIPSKSRAEIALTPKVLNRMGVDYRLVVEPDQVDDYAAKWGAGKILTLDPQYKRDYLTCDDYGLEISTGSGPARNFIWDHAQAEGAKFHWVIDDNVMTFLHLNRNRSFIAGDGAFFHAMESFVLRYKNIGLAGPEYKHFIPLRQKRAPFITGGKIYSTLLIRTDLPYRWECRYNEDVDLGLRMLKDGWATVAFLAYAQDKVTTQIMPGGNTEAFYQAKGTAPKSQMLVARHPDVATIKWRYRRWHHHVDYSRWRGMRLIRDPGYDEPMPDYGFVEKPQTEKIYGQTMSYKPGHQYSKGEA